MFLPSDTQPLAVLFGLIIIGSVLVIKNTLIIPIYSIPALLIFIIASLSLLFNFLGIFGGISFIDLIRAYWSYITPFIIILSLHYYSKAYGVQDVPKVLDFVLGFFYFGVILNILNLTWIIQLVVNRSLYNIDDPSNNERGFPSFFPEQSSIPEQLIFMIFVYLILGTLTKKRLFFCLLGCVLSFAAQFAVIIVEILLAFVLTIFIKAIINTKLSKKSLYIFLLIATFTIAGIFLGAKIAEWILLNTGFPTRGIDAIRIILTNGTYGFSDDVGIIVKLSGLFAVLSTLYANPFVFEIGYAFKNNYTEAKKVLGDTYYKIESFVFGNPELIFFDRVYSAMGTWILDFGIIGAIISLIMIIYMWYKTLTTNPKNNFYLVWSSAFITFCFIIKVQAANPTIWAFYGFIMIQNYNHYRRKQYYT